MKVFLFISILILAFYGGAFAQTDEISPCPIIELIGPASSMPAEPMIFTAALSKEAEKFNLEYKWTASGGEIIKGQGTLSVTALQSDLGGSLTLTFEVAGLPKSCANTVSETAPTYCPPPAQVIGEFSLAASQINKARLDNFAAGLQNTPSAVGYITENFSRKTLRKAIEQKNQKIFHYLKTRGIEEDRIVLQNAFADENLTQFVLVPAGASPPSCDDCTTIRPN